MADSRSQTRKFQGQPRTSCVRKQRRSRRFTGLFQKDTGAGFKRSNVRQYGHHNYKWC